MNGLTERFPGIYEAVLSSGSKSIDEIKIFLIPGGKGKRSLMIDAGFRSRSCLEKMRGILGEMGISFEELDLFLTHKHHDHCGLAAEYAELGARLYMNPLEERHSYDCLYYNNRQGQTGDQAQVLRSVGVTPEDTPEVWGMFEAVRRRVEEKRGWEFEIPPFSYLPVAPGQRFYYGAYEWEAVPLKGHTFGQMGLVDRKKGIFFCADQVIDGIIPIVGTSYGDEHLLKGYFDSLEELKHNFSNCLFLPSHREPVAQVRPVADRIIFSYIDKTDLLINILDHARRPMTIREAACLAYGMNQVPEDEREFIKLKMVMSKTFSCLEYLYDEDFVIRTQEEGTYYWQSARL